MAAKTTKSRPVRSLVLLAVIIAVIYGAIAVGVQTKQSGASWTPKLALDLEGGTQVILSPQLQGGKAPTQDEINQAIAVMRQRVDASGVAEAEITSQGGGKIVVALPGHPSQETLDLVRTSAIMNFRPVLQALPPGKLTPNTPSPSVSGQPAPSASPSAGTPSANPSAEPAPKASAKNSAARSKATVQNGSYVRPKAETSPAPTPAPTAAPEQAGGVASPNDATNQSLITEQVQSEAYALDCTDPKNRTGGPQDDQNRLKPLVACSQDGKAKYILGPVAVEGSTISQASSGLKPLGQTVSNEWVVNLSFNPTGTKQFAGITAKLATFANSTEQGQNSSMQSAFAIVLDSLVISAPTVSSEIPNGQAYIEGNFTQESSSQLANQLKFGSLPISFTTESEDQISATLGTEQLQHGLLAGLIGLILVALYSLIQYRALGFVTIFSLIIAAIMAYGVITLLGWTQGYRLSLPGVCGLIVAIGITADSFIVYFERIKDQVRDGRAYGQAVEEGWKHARRTILASDTVNFLAAIVLYLLAVGGVRGFAFTLGLTTILDLIIVFLFTHPVVTLLGRTRFFAEGHKLSGVDPRRLGAPEALRYKGRGRFSGSTVPDDESVSIAERKAGKRLAAAGAGGGTATATMTTSKASDALSIAERKARAAREADAGPDGETTSRKDEN